MDIKGLLSDPEFLALDEPTQRQVLARLDPDFNTLSREQYQEFRLRAHPPTQQQSAQLSKNAQALKGLEGNLPTQDAGFIPTLLHDIKQAPSSLMDFLSGHPMQDMFNSVGDQARAVKEAEARNDYSSAIGHTLAGILPVVGPGSAQAGEELGGGQPRQGAAHALELLAPSAIHGVRELPWQNPVVRERVPAIGSSAGSSLTKFLPTKWKIGKAIYDAVTGDSNPTPYIRTKTSLRSPLDFGTPEESTPFGSKPVLPPLYSDVQSRLNSLPPPEPSMVDRIQMDINTKPLWRPYWTDYPINIDDVNAPPEPGIPHISPWGNTGVTVNFGVKWPNELWGTVRDAVIDNPQLGSRVAELVRSSGRDTVTIPDFQGALSARPRTPLWKGMPDADSAVAPLDPIGPVAFPSGRVPGAGISKPPAPPPAAQPATSPVQPQGPIQSPTPAPVQPVGESMPQNTVMGGAEAHRYAHAQAQAAELPGSPAGTRGGAHDALTAIAKAKYGKNAWHELAPTQMQEIGDWLLDINMQRAQKAGQGIPPVK